MGKRGIEILGLNVEALVKTLNEALSEEWLAYYQYWIGAKVMEGPMRTNIESELVIHANQELNHATLLAERIIQLGGTPVLSPDEWSKLAHCKYQAPEDNYIEAVLKQNLDSERCAIQRYKDIIDSTNGKDHTTHQLAITILNEEIEHEQDIEDWIKDINRIKEQVKSLKLD